MADSSPPVPSGADILLVDDRPANLLALEAILSGLGDDLVRAASGEAALALLSDHDFAVVLLDVRMPGLSGFETAKRMRASGRARHTPVIFLSAAESDEFPVAEAYRLGAVDYLLKPLVPDILRAKVAVFVDLFRKAERVRELERRERERAEAALGRSEERYRTLFTSIDEGFCVIEVLFDAQDRPADYRFLEVNPAFEKHTGLHNAVGRTIRELAPSHERHWFEVYGKVARTGEPVRFENEARAIGGRWFDVYAFRLGGPGGRKVAVLFTDITARRRAEDALRESEGRFRTLAAHAPVGIFLTDREGNCLFVNDRWREVSGLSGQEAHGRGWARALHPDDRERVFREWHAAAEAGRPFAGEYRFRTPEGKVTWLQGSAIGLPGEVGRVAGYIGTLTDITERREAGEALKEAARRKDEFLAMLAHELRNPLAPLRNAIQILQLRGGDVGVVDQVRAMMERQVVHLGRLVDDLLDVSRITNGKVQLKRERLDLARLARQAVADHLATYEAKGVSLLVDAPGTPVWVSGDHTRLAQILDNLLTNALKFTAEGGGVSVCAAADPGREQAVLSVRDTGAGIEPEMLGRLFEPFSQADRTLDRSPGGLGLGLAIVKGLAELHGGCVRAESAGLGRGSSFIVTLPLRVELAALSDHPAPARPAAKHLRVLVVEDNRDAADSLRMLLDAYGYEVTVAYSGPDGVRAAEEHQPDVVVCDIGLPGMDGYTVAAALRGNPATASARLIALTGYGQEEDRRRAKDAGFDHHLTKPADPAALEAVVGGREGPL
jgi:PAS domain S-box-containing protein